MPNVLIRNLDEKVLERLKKSAKENHRSLQAEIHAVLERADISRRVRTQRISARLLRELKGMPQTDSTEMIREDRER